MHTKIAPLSRRAWLAGAAACAAFPGAAVAQAILTEDGLHRQPWFIDSLLELADDVAAATANKKRFAVLFELRGCPYCKQMHEINLAKPEIAAFIKDRFDVLQLNFIGSREVTDFDGERLVYNRPDPIHGELAAAPAQLHPSVVAAMRTVSAEGVALR